MDSDDRKEETKNKNNTQIDELRIPETPESSQTPGSAAITPESFATGRDTIKELSLKLQAHADHHTMFHEKGRICIVQEVQRRKYQ